jgi:peptidoglycan/LPS O-acetylase OafA/YrhL
MTVIDLAAHRHRDAPDAPVGPVRTRAFRPDIQAMRAIAVLLVVLYHAGVPFLPGGFVGVDVFFVVSGYLITAHLLGELLATGHISLPRFYARRAKRLLPMATLVILSTLVATWILTTGLQARAVADDALWAGLFAMNVHLANEGVDYQAANGTGAALQHFWSLAIEEQFYLIWPLLLALASLGWWRSRRRARADPAVEVGNVETRPGVRISTTALTVAVVLVLILSFADGVHQTRVAQSLAYFVTPARAWELAAGGLVALHAPWLARRRWLQQNWLMVAGLVAVLIAAVVLTDSSAFPGWLVLLPVLGSAAMITAGLNSATGIERLAFTSPAMQGLGNISYSLYLWHWPMLVLAPAFFDVERLSPEQRVIVVGFAIWLATISSLGLEDPIRRMRQLSTGRALSVGAWLIVTVVVTSLAASLWIPDPKATGSYVAPVSGLDNLQRANTLSATRNAVPSNVQPELARAAQDKPSATSGDGKSCMVNLLDSTLSRSPSGSCVFGDRSGSRTVVLTGDSHAYEWFPALESLALKNHWRLVNLTKSGCALYAVQVVNTILKRDYRECYTWRTNVFQRIIRESPDLVITSAFTGSVNRDPTFTGRWLQGEASTIDRLRSTGAKVIVLADTPYPDLDIPSCLALHVTEATKCASPRVVALSDPERRRLGSVTAFQQGAAVIDPIPWFCNNATCPAVVGNVIVYSDTGHMTATYARLLASRLERALATAGRAGS